MEFIKIVKKSTGSSYYFIQVLRIGIIFMNA